MKEYITPELIYSELPKITGYEGKIYINNKFVDFTAQEMSFSMYLYAIQDFLRDSIGDKNYLDKKATQNDINTAKKFILTIADSYINPRTKKVSFNPLEYRKKIEALNLNGRSLSNLESLMPYVIQYSLTTKGYDFENPNVVKENIFKDLDNEKFVKNTKVTDKEYVDSLCRKLNKNVYDMYHPEKDATR